MNRSLQLMSAFEQVLKYNGRRIINLKHLAQMVLFDEEKFMRFELHYGVSHTATNLEVLLLTI